MFFFYFYLCLLCVFTVKQFEMFRKVLYNTIIIINIIICFLCKNAYLL